MKYLTRWQRPNVPDFGRLTDLRDEIDRLFEAPLAELARGTHLLRGWTPALDVYEDKDNLFVKIELPGMKREEIEPLASSTSVVPFSAAAQPYRK